MKKVAHTDRSQMGMGDFYGSGIKNKVAFPKEFKEKIKSKIKSKLTLA